MCKCILKLSLLNLKWQDLLCCSPRDDPPDSRCNACHTAAHTSHKGYKISLYDSQHGRHSRTVGGYPGRAVLRSRTTRSSRPTDDESRA